MTDLTILLAEKAKLLKKIEELQIKVEKLKREIVEAANLTLLEKIPTSIQNKELFGYYLKETKNLKDSSVLHYFSSLEQIKLLFQTHLNITLPCDLYYINDRKKFEIIIYLFESSNELTNLNKKHHYDLSAAYNNYLNFLKKLEQWREK